MRVLIASVVLAFTLASPALPYQQQQHPQAQKPTSQNTSTPSSPETVVVNQPAAPAQSNAPKNKAEDRPIWSNWALVAVGVVAAIIAIRSLQAIQKQAEATEIAATAARDNARAVINAERAWIMVDVGKVPGNPMRTIGNSYGVESVGLYVRFACRNDGKTPAWITEKKITGILINEFAEPLSQSPDFSFMEWGVSKPEPLASGQDSFEDIWIEIKGSHSPQHRLIVYGIIKYRDVFYDGRTTTFGYSVSLSDQFTRLVGYPEYNKNT